MTGFSKFCRLLVLPVAVLFASGTIVPSLATAQMVGTERVITEETALAERDQVADFLARDEVQAELSGYGIDPAEAEARIAALSDSEVSQLAGYLHEEPAGEGIGAVVGAAVFVFVVLLITDIAGFTNIFPFIIAQR